jgi:streptogramin lyase
MRPSLSHAAIVAALFALAGCGGGSSNRSALPPVGDLSSARSIGDAPDVAQTGKTPINWTQFAGPASGYSVQYAVTVGADKNLWYANGQGGLLQVQMSGKQKLVPLTYVYSGTSSENFDSGYGIAVGKDNNFYMTGSNYHNATSLYTVGVATTAGKLTIYDIPSGDSGGQGGLTLGPDGNVWFIEQKHIASITTGGKITEYQYPSEATSNSYGDVTTGSDGNVWFTEYNNGIVGKIVPSTGKITEYTLSAQSISCSPEDITSASDGKLYISCGNGLLQMSTAGVGKLYSYPYDVSYIAEGLIKGPDGNPWFADSNGSYISEFDPYNQSFTTYYPPYTGGTVYTLALGPDGNIWSLENDNKIDVYIVNTLVASPASFAFTATGQKASMTITEPSTSKWTATSVSTGVCSVAQGSSPDVFTVTANGGGKTTITVKDAIGNSLTVPCSVK